MAWEVQADVWKHSRSTGTARLVLLAIANNCSKDTRRGVSKIGTLAELANCSYRWVQWSIIELQALGELRVYTIINKRPIEYEIPRLPVAVPELPPHFNPKRTRDYLADEAQWERVPDAHEKQESERQRMRRGVRRRKTGRQANGQ